MNVEKEKDKAVVLVSGGMDSCVTTAIARTKHELALAHVSYGQRTAGKEQRAFEAIADFYGVSQRLAVKLDHFRQIGGSALTDERIAVPERGSAREGYQRTWSSFGTPGTTCPSWRRLKRDTG